MKRIKEFDIKNEINVKRFSFDGVIELDCPNCDGKIKRDFSEDYLPYPTPGEKLDLYFLCNDCDNEFEMPGKLESIKVEISYELDKLKKV